MANYVPLRNCSLTDLVCAWPVSVTHSTAWIGHNTVSHGPPETLSIAGGHIRWGEEDWCLFILFCECCIHCRFQRCDCHRLLCGGDSVHLQILLMGTCQQCGSRSVTLRNHRKVIGWDPICASYHDMGLDLSKNWRPCMTREIEIWLSDIVGSVTIVWLTTEADD